MRSIQRLGSRASRPAARGARAPGAPAGLLTLEALAIGEAPVAPWAMSEPPSVPAKDPP